MTRHILRPRLLVLALAGLFFGASAQFSLAQTPAKPDDDPMKRPVAPENAKKQKKALKQELSKEYKDWLDNDVRWIITDEERAAFKQLSNDNERDQFIENFWLRRDPTPDTVENEFRDEHYRRIEYANEHYAAGIPGSRTDRGMIYIRFGPADTIDSHPSGGGYERTMEEGGGSTSTYPFEIWRYRYLPGANLGNEVQIEFVDTCGCGAYHITLDPCEKDALAHTPGAGQTMAESMGLSTQADRFTGPTTCGPSMTGQADNSGSKYFDKMAQYAAISAAQPVKFKELEERVNTKIRYNLMPFDLRTDIVKVTPDTMLVPITIQVKNRDITFLAKDGIQRGLVNIFGRVTSLTGKTMQVFEDSVNVDVPNDLLEKTQNNSSLYWKSVPLKPGIYKLEVVVKDINGNGDRLGTYSHNLVVPKMDEDQGLLTSSLIVADVMEKVSTKDVGAGSFVIGTTKVRPKVLSSDGKPATFKRTQKASFWMQVYNIGIDKVTLKNNTDVEYEIINTDTKKQIVTSKENSLAISPNSDQITLEKSLPLMSVESGPYQITIKITDNVNKNTLTKVEKFIVE